MVGNPIRLLSATTWARIHQAVDISHATRTWPVHRRFSEMINEEFFNQVAAALHSADGARGVVKDGQGESNTHLIG